MTTPNSTTERGVFDAAWSDAISCGGLHGVKPHVACLILNAYLASMAAQSRQPSAQGGERACTCHPDDNPPVPCAKQYALADCRATIGMKTPEPDFIARLGRMSWDYESGCMRADEEGPFVAYSDVAATATPPNAPQDSQVGDAERLDWLDGLNHAMNERNKTTYGWKLVLSPHVTRLMAGRHDKGLIADIDLHDSAPPSQMATDIRAAIDMAIRAGKKG